MENLFDAYTRAVTAWAATVSTNAITRTNSALRSMRDGSYTTEKLMQDVYRYWQDLAGFRAQAALGVFPSASLTVSAWAGNEKSNFVQAPAAPIEDFELTPVVNPQTSTALPGCELIHWEGGPNAIQISWTPVGSAPSEPLDRNGLFLGAIYWRKDGNARELIAPVYVRTHLG